MARAGRRIRGRMTARNLGKSITKVRKLGRMISRSLGGERTRSRVGHPTSKIKASGIVGSRMHGKVTRTAIGTRRIGEARKTAGKLGRATRVQALGKRIHKATPKTRARGAALRKHIYIYTVYIYIVLLI